jgi:hypothetical protein
MTHATVRANARTLPEATNRRAAFGIIAAGAVGATVALSSAASGAIAPSEPRENAALLPSSLKRELSTCFRTRSTMLRMPLTTE